MEALGVPSRGLWICLLAPLLFSSCAVVGGQNVEITQRPESLSVTAGETLNLTCTLTGENPPGAVRWYKGLDRSQPPIYSDKEGAPNRGVRVIPGSSTDFSISIRNILPEDAGTYYCVKVTTENPERQLASGKGTVVFLIARPSQPLLRGPPGRITGSRASFNCSSEGFSPREITVTWLKDGKEIEGAQTRILDSGEQQNISYRVESTVEVLLVKGDVRSQLTCQIQHSSLEAPLQQDFPLGDILTVTPSVHFLSFISSHVPLNTTGLVLCSMENFYPDDAKLELFNTGTPRKKGKVGPSTLNSDGTYSLAASLVVVATEDRNASNITCMAQHNSRPLANFTRTLLIEHNKSSEGNPTKPTILIVAVVVSALLVVW